MCLVFCCFRFLTGLSTRLWFCFDSVSSLSCFISVSSIRYKARTFDTPPLSSAPPPPWFLPSHFHEPVETGSANHGDWDAVLSQKLNSSARERIVFMDVHGYSSWPCVRMWERPWYCMILMQDDQWDALPMCDCNFGLLKTKTRKWHMRELPTETASPHKSSWMLELCNVIYILYIC